MIDKERIRAGIVPSFDTMTELSDESIADILTWLVAFVDAFEDHYAQPLSRGRQMRYEELHHQGDEEQMCLPIDSRIDDPF